MATRTHPPHNPQRSAKTNETPVMQIEVGIPINGTKEAIWKVITDFDNAAETISGIEKVEVLERPQDGLVGFKWRETRTLFGKTATEEIWITDCVEQVFYKTRAESHGAIYTSTISISERESDCLLTMSFQGVPQGFFLKLLSLPMGLLFKGPTKKALLKDLQDIKAAVEQKTD